MSGKNYVDPLLTQVAKGYRPKNHINELVLPPLYVVKATAKIANYGGSNMRLVSTIKAPEGETPTVSCNVTQDDAYTLVEQALKALASDSDIENQDSPFDTMRDKTEFVMDLLSIAREYGLANYMGTVGNFTNSTTLSGTAQWGGAADAPITNIDTAIQTVAEQANVDDGEVTLIFPRNVFRKLIFLDEIQSTLGFANRPAGVSPQIIRPDQIAQLFGVKQVLIAAGRYNSAAEGQTDSFSNIWGKHAWALYAGDPKIKQYSFGYTCKRKAGPVADRWYDSDRKGTWCRATDEWDQYILDEKCCYMIENAIA